jgi:hypothetical protein
MYTGSCLCGSVQYQIEGELEPIQLCHCQQCRKAQGTPFVSNIPVQATAFSIVSGRESLKEYESSPGKFRAFCGNCGSPILSRRTSMPEVVRIRAGSINEALPVKPEFHIFAAHKANWWEIHDELPQYSEFAP